MALDIESMVSKDIAREVKAHGMNISITKSQIDTSSRSNDNTFCGFVDVTVTTIDGNTTHTKNNISALKKEIDHAVINAKTACAKDIDNRKGIAHIVLEFSKETLRGDEKEQVWLPEVLKQLFDIELIVGTCRVGDKPSQLHMLIEKDSLPSFRNLIDYSDVNLLALINGHIKEFTENTSESLGGWDINELLTTNRVYSEWPTIPMKSLLHSLFDCIKGINLVHTKIDCGSLRGKDLLAVA